MRNLNLLFNKLYYEELDKIFPCSEPKKENGFTKSLDNLNKKLFGAVFYHETDYKPSLVASEENFSESTGEWKKGCFLLQTAYPGLLIGTGNPHGSHQSNDDINLGFSFDYVTGQPYIPGNSVKGALRCHFREQPAAVEEVLEKFLRISGIHVKKLEEEIFEGNDVFLDAVVYDGASGSNRVMDADYITPHSSPTKNPVPIFITKVLPTVRFEFRFKLTDGIITAGQKKALFKILLMIFGIGAKTNVGYGIFEECDGKIVAHSDVVRQDTEQSTQREDTRPANNRDFKICTSCGKRNYKYRMENGVVTSKINFNWTKNVCFVCKGALE